MGKVRQGHPLASWGVGTARLGRTVWGSHSSSLHDFGNRGHKADGHTKADDKRTAFCNICCTLRFLTHQIRKPHLSDAPDRVGGRLA